MTAIPRLSARSARRLAITLALAVAVSAPAAQAKPSFMSSLASAMQENRVVTGGGSGPAAPVLMAWAEQFHQRSGKAVTFKLVLAPTAISEAASGALDFAVLSEPLSSGALTARRLVQVPLLAGGIVPVVNLPEVGPGRLNLSGELLAQIYLGRIRRWDDPALADLNPDTPLPALDVTVLHRADAAVPTLYLTAFLARRSADWSALVGAGPRVSWPVGTPLIGEPAMVEALRATPGAIGYADFWSVRRSDLNTARLRNAEGRFVEARPPAFAIALGHTDWKAAMAGPALPVDAAGADSWPITKTTFLVMSSHPKRLEHARTVADFCRWAAAYGSDAAARDGQWPAPATLIAEFLPHGGGAPDTTGAPLSALPAKPSPQTAEVSAER